MKKLAALFQASYGELRSVRTITTMAMFGAVGVVLGSLTIQIGDFIKIGFSTIANQFVYYLFGPAAGCFFGGAMDILKYLIKPTGAFFPGWTISAMTAGVLYGCFFYKKKLSLKRVLAAELTVAVICNIFLGTLWLDMMYGKGFFALLPMRAFKNLVMWPVNSFLFYSMTWALEQSGVFRAIRRSA
ncbi:MAG: folate family ECF transporter S component [Hungatella sp.]|nr:folate family ECF transporter S component [Hungatella sp.]